MESLKFLATLIFASAMMAMAAGCNDDEELGADPSISVSPTIITFSADGGSQTVSVSANAPWAVECPDWVTVSPSSDSGDCDVVVTAEDNSESGSEERTGTLTFALTSGEDEATVDVSQEGNDAADDTDGDSEPRHGAGSDGIMKILAIGNSFTADCVEQNLWELFDAAGIEAVLGNMYIGSATPEDHYSNAMSNSAAYSYRKVVNGVKTTTGSVTMLYGIEDEDWDYIVFNPNGRLSTQYETKIAPYIPHLLDYVNSYATNPEMEPVLMQGWAYPEDSTNSDYLRYFDGQMDMYNAIVNCFIRAMDDFDVDILIPAGTAIQNGRNTYLGDTFNRDGQHLNYTYGRYTAACAWFETFSGIDATTTTYAPDDISDEIKDLSVHAAHFAVEDPYEINPMVDWQADPRPQVVNVSEFAACATSVTVAWNFADCTEEETTAYAYTASLYNDEACTDLRVSWNFDARSGSASESGTSIWKPGSQPRVRFIFGDLEPETDYWVVVNVQGDEDSANEPLKVTTTASFGTELTVVSENAQPGDVILVENFDKLIHGGDPANKGAGVNPTSSNRSTLARIEGENPSGFSQTKWHATGIGPFPSTYTGVQKAYTEAVGLGDWCTGYSSGNPSVGTRPGYIKVGNTSSMGYLATPELKAIPDGKVATVRVDFKAMPYYYGSSYCNYIVMGVVNYAEPDEYQNITSWTDSADNGGVENKTQVTVSQVDGEWLDYSTELSGITNASRIRFSSYNSSKGAFMLDDIVITVLSVEDVQYNTLDIPTNVKIDDTGSTNFTISWDGVTGADSYTVKYWAEGDESGALTESTYSMSVTITGLTPSTTYYAQVMACSDGGEQYNSDYSDTVSCTTAEQNRVYVSEYGDPSATTVTAVWIVDDCTEEESTTYAFTAKLYNDEACTDLRVSWNFDAREGSASSSGTSVWKPGNTAHTRFTFADLEPETSYWLKVNIRDDEGSVSDPFKFTTTASFGADLTVVGENAQAGDVILVENFDKLIHGSDPAKKAVGVFPESSNRSTLARLLGENPSGFSQDKYNSTGYSPIANSSTGIGKDYTEAVGLSDWCTSYSSTGQSVSSRPGYIKVGRTSYKGYLATPELKAIPDGKTATVRVDFKAMPYQYSTYYCQYIMMCVVDNVELDGYQQSSNWTSSSDDVAEEDMIEVAVEQNAEVFLDYSVELSGVSNASRIRFSSYSSSRGVFLLDDIVITVVEIQ